MMTTPDKDTDQREIVDAAAFLAAHARGRSNGEVSRDLADVVAAVEATRKAGKVTVTITLRPEAEADDGRMIVTVESKPSIPRYAPYPGIYWPDGGNLSRTDPLQESFDFGDRRLTD